MRANLDGSEIETLVDASQGDSRPGSDQRKWCVGIAVDTDDGKFYWTQKGGDSAGFGQFFRANIQVPQGQSAENRRDIELLFMTTSQSPSIWTSIRLIGRCIGPTAGTRRGATR